MERIFVIVILLAAIVAVWIASRRSKRTRMVVTQRSVPVPSSAKCGTIDHHVNEIANVDGPHVCRTHCDCDGQRVCSANNWCENQRQINP